VGTFAPGRFTNAIQKTNFAHHALQVFREDGARSAEPVPLDTWERSFTF
jgi:hypothetical protein